MLDCRNPALLDNRWKASVFIFGNSDRQGFGAAVAYFVFEPNNGDGAVNLLDVDGFILLISNDIYQIEADINGDGVVNLLDIAAFITLLGS